MGFQHRNFKIKSPIQLHSSHCYWQTRFVVSQKLLTDDFFFQFMVIWGNYFWSLFPTADIKTPAKTGANFGCIRWWAPFPHHHQLLMSIAYQCTRYRPWFFYQVGIKPRKHLWEINILSLNNVIIKPTKIMNIADKNWTHF